MNSSQKMSPPNLLYLSSIKDEELLEDLVSHLSPLRNRKMIDDWRPSLTLAGQERAKVLMDRLNQAAFILLLISAHFLDEYSESEELRCALERHEQGKTHVIPILIRPCLWQIGPLASFSPLPANGLPINSWSDRDAAFTEIIESILTRLEGSPGYSQYKHIRISIQKPLLKKSDDPRHILIARVQRYWIEGKLPQGSDWITLRLREQPDLVANPFRQAMQESDRPARFFPAGTRLVDIHDERVHNDGLLILGAPGSGKSMLLWELTRDLLERAKLIETEPVPVIFLLSSWASSGQRPLERWLVEQLKRSYYIPPEHAKTWIEQNHIIPILDGLDEVPPAQRSSCIDAINAFRERQTFLPLIVSSRESDYRKLNNQLHLQTAVIIQPLTIEQITRYALFRQRSLDGLSTDLRPLLQQPLMLNILTTVDVDALPSALSSEQTYQSIFEKYVQEMFNRGNRQYSLPQISCWLSWLARQLSEHEQTAFFIERIQQNWLPEHQERLLNRVLVLLFKLTIGISLSVVGNTTNGVIGGLFGLVTGICFASAELVEGEIEPAEKLTWSWRHIRSGLLQTIFSSSTLALGVLFISLCLAIISSFLKPIAFATALPSLLTAGAILASGGTVLLLLEAGLSSTVMEQREHMQPNQGIWQSGLNGLLAGVPFGLLTGLTLSNIPGNDPGYGVACGCVLGLTFALLRGGIAFIKHMLVRLILWHQGLAPLNYQRFLQYAVKHMLLQTAGGGYIFYHNLLLDYFKHLDFPQSSKNHTD